ncbi:aconitate hydratase AcnA [Sphingomicrobium sediminis]|uniref:Aconitate hydratase n=1 Tax=Sphingomicrobium sediminis TaxID=2950949 RepID=A0A9X2EIY5_9SPHN|nr:aconitate hydratase AcnA [Sphingomicrobium sediminis]MCM8558365.1 aconitate hydratase AcnA [Sphingomicrobium sediminis]
MTATGQDSLNTRTMLDVNGEQFAYYSLPKAAEKVGDVSRLPFSMKVLLENMLRFEDGSTVTTDDVQAIADWQKERRINREIQYRPARVLMQDFTGVPAVVDLAAMRDGIKALGGDPQKINPQVPVHLVIDHSVMVDEFGTPMAFEKNVEREYERNKERYEFLKWGSTAFDNFKVVPPGTGICHQVNLEYIARAVWSSNDANGDTVAYPDTLVGTDSHTTMVNGLGVLGWGVGGIEAEAAMLGQPISMLVPEVVGFKLTGEMAEGITATDLVLVIVQMLREKGVVGRFVEFYGPGLAKLSLADRATIANMAPEYGATCGFFPIDQRTMDYMELSGRGDQIPLIKAYCQAQGMWHDENSPEPVFTDTLHLDMGTVEPSLAGPKRPQDRVLLSDMASEFHKLMETQYEGGKKGVDIPVEGEDYGITDGDVVIAAITSCTNTSNPDVMIAAGLVAKKARELGLNRKPWVKTSLAPGSQVVTDYLDKAGLSDDLDAIGFDLVGYGCTTCIGNSGPLPAPVSKAINENDLVACSVLSGNRNFEGRVSPDVRANYLASPPLVVAYALLGNTRDDITTCAIGQDKDGNDVFLKDIWPTNEEVRALVDAHVNADMFRSRYADVFKGDDRWQRIEVSGGATYDWPAGSTYIQNPPYFQGMGMDPNAITDIEGARPLAIFGDSITTDHISPAGAIKADSPAGSYLQEHQVPRAEFNSYGARRGNHEVMMRGTFANIRIRNQMLDDVEGGFTKGPEGQVKPIYDAAMAYMQSGTPLVVLAGKEYGTGSSRDWAAKGTILQGVKAVIAESFERIHRSNLVGMGVLPLQFQDGEGPAHFGFDGSESFSIKGLADLEPRQDVSVVATRANGETVEFTAKCRIDTYNELEYFKNSGILHYVLRKLAA